MRKGLFTFVALIALTTTALYAGGSASKSATPGATTAGTTTVEFFALKSEVTDIMNKLIGDFEAKNPGVHIEYTVTPDPWGVLTTRMMGNDTPEIFMTWGGPDFRSWVANGYLADLTGSAAAANVSQDALDMLRVNGRDFLVPIARNVLGLFINTDMFKQYNLNAPTTWAELLRVCDTFKAAGIPSLLIDGKDVDSIHEETQVHLLTMPSWPALDSDIQKKIVDFSNKGKPYYQDIRDMAQRVIQIFGYAQADVMGAGADQVRDDFATGKGAMFIDGSWGIASISGANANLNYKMIPYPAATAQATRIAYAPDDLAVAYSAKAKHPDIAKNFLAFLTSKDAAQYYAEQTGTLSCIKSVNYTSPYLKDVYDAINAGKGVAYPNYEWSAEQMDGVSAAFQLLYSTKDVEGFCAALQAGFNSAGN